MLKTEILDLAIQPLKGGGSLYPERALLTRAGLETTNRKVKDHEHVVLTRKKDDLGFHNFLTQRVQVDPEANLFTEGSPKLALVQPEERGEDLYFRFPKEDGKFDEVRVPRAEEVDLSREVPAQVWEYRGWGVEESELSRAVSDWIHKDVLVARTAGRWDRMARQNRMVNTNPLRAQDGYPVLAIAQEDSDKMFGVLRATTDNSRLRAQVVLGGLPFRAIHDFQKGIINGVVVKQAYPCRRCEVPGIDQKTGEFSPIKPLAGLVRLGVGRLITRDGEKEERKHVAGENWLPQGETEIKEEDVFEFTDLRLTPLVFEPTRPARS